MTNIEEAAIISFRGGLNCSQAVVTAFAERLSYDKEMASQISAGFGGGMGRLQETCGVVTGAFMVIGIFNSQLFKDNLDRKEKSYEMIQEFNRRFMEIHHSNTCRDLINCDLRTAEGRAEAKENRLHETICEGCMVTSIKILNQMIPDQNNIEE